MISVWVIRASRLPLSIKAAILDVLDNEDSRYVHGYMSNAGYESVRQAVADDLRKIWRSPMTWMIL